MKEELIIFETAKLAKEKGFNNGSFNIWHHNGEYTMTSNSLFRDNGVTMMHNEKGYIEAPTQSLLQKWLRENHDLHLCVGLDSSLIEEPNYDYQFINHSQTVDYSETNFNTYEEALEKGLYEALKLIK